MLRWNLICRAIVKRAVTLLTLMLQLSLPGLWSAAAFAQDTPFVSPLTTQDPSFPVFEASLATPRRIETGPNLGVLIDTSRILGIDDVLSATANWKPVGRRSPNFGFTANAYWFRFQIANLDIKPAIRYIELPISFMDEVHFFHHVNGEKRQEYLTGDERPFALRPVVHQNFVLPVLLEPGLNQIHLRLRNAGSVEAPLRIWDPVSFQVANQREKLAQGMIIGTLLIMVIYNLFVLLGTRDPNYLYYIAFVLSFLLFQYTLSGYTYAYVWPQAVWWNSVALPVFICMSEMSVAVFCMSFLRVKERSRWVYRTMLGFIGLTGAMAILSLILPYSIAIRVSSGLAIPISAFCLSLGYWRWWRGDHYARYFCVAWTAALMGVIVLAAGKFGAIPVNFWTENASQMGIVSLVVLLSITLVDQINHDRTSRIEAQEQALEHERSARASEQALIAATTDANRKLEERVEARTQDLNATLEQLQEANTKLHQLTLTDALTQISNRASFDQALASEFKRAIRHQTHLTVMMLDVDHFKRINDTWGHPAGDACLRALARELHHKVQRAGDMVARFGGEEFAVLLGDTRPDDAVRLAEAFRTAVEVMPIPFGDLRLKLTVSVGIICAIPAVHAKPLDWIVAADRALYLAKENGRNQVIVANS